MRRSLARLALVLPLAAAPLAARAQGVTAAAAFRAEYLRQLDDAEKKLVSLAEAIPQDKYGWRPGPGVRSISEVYMHIAGADLMIPSALGLKPPAMNRDDETKVTDKKQVVEALKKSFAHARAAAAAVKDEELGAPVKLFGAENT
ncbi:MAG: DinB family protein, partial [Gemmatimonadetes bacterium]|nr:DinB family protein [Gemmatimonadota bacterium]